MRRADRLPGAAHGGRSRAGGPVRLRRAAHLLCQLATWEGREVLAFTRAGDTATQALARSLGALWAGAASDPPPQPLDAALIFAAAGELVPVALGAVRPGGVVVCAGIHMSKIPSFAYELLWGERTLCSVANLTRADGREFLDLAARALVCPRVSLYRLQHADDALDAVRTGRVDGAAVIEIA